MQIVQGTELLKHTYLYRIRIQYYKSSLNIKKFVNRVKEYVFSILVMLV